jgi:hypothetical protein
LRLALALVLLLSIAGRFGSALVTPLLPAFTWEICQIEPELRVLRLAIGRAGADTVLRVDAGPAVVVAVAGRLLPLAPQSRFTVSTPFGHVLQPLIVCLAILVAWPAGRPMRYLLRTLFGIPLLALLPLLDVPLVLAAELHGSLLDLAAPGAFSPLIAWKAFLEGGGRLVLGGAVAAMVVIVAEALAPASPPLRR